MADNQGGVQPGASAQAKPTTLSWSQAVPAKSESRNPVSTRTPVVVKKSNSGRNVTIAFIIGVIVGALLMWAWQDTRQATPSNTASSGTNSSNTLAVTGATDTTSGSASGAVAMNSNTPSASDGQQSTDTITVVSPQPAGTVVTVGNISATDDVWAVVYEYQNGMMGRALGAARFTTDRRSGTIELMRATLPNLTYAVALTADSPDHSFTLHQNAPLLGADGKQIMTQFTAQ